MSHARAQFSSAFVTALALAALLPMSAFAAGTGTQAAPSSDGEALLQQTIGRYCATCHNDRLQTAGLVLTGLDLAEVGAHAETWEKVVTKLRTRTMPPVGRPRPAVDTYDALAGWLETEIDRFAAARPNPGRTEAFHRLNRAEYANAIRDLLALDVDVAELLPADDIDEYGFDNMADVLTVSPALMERYLSAARKIGRLAVGETPLGPATETYDVPILLVQDDRMGDDVPFGSRGGIGNPPLLPGRRGVRRRDPAAPQLRELRPGDGLAPRAGGAAGRRARALVRLRQRGARRDPGPGQLRRQPVRRPGVGRVHALRRRQHARPLPGDGRSARGQRGVRPAVHRAGRGAATRARASSP